MKCKLHKLRTVGEGTTSFCPTITPKSLNKKYLALKEMLLLYKSVTHIPPDPYAKKPQSRLMAKYNSVMVFLAKARSSYRARMFWWTPSSFILSGDFSARDSNYQVDVKTKKKRLEARGIYSAQSVVRCLEFEFLQSALSKQRSSVVSNVNNLLLIHRSRLSIEHKGSTGRHKWSSYRGEFFTCENQVQVSWKNKPLDVMLWTPQRT